MTHFGEIDFFVTKFKISRKKAKEILITYGDFDEAIDEFEFQINNRITVDNLPSDKSTSINPSPMNEELKEEIKVIDNESKEEGPKILPKPYTVHKSSAAMITRWVEVPIRELVDFCKYQMIHAKVDPKEFICPICRCDYYNDMLTLSDKEIDELDTKMIKGEISIDVVMLSKCKKHFYHKDCVEPMAKDTASVKCAICGVIYGTLYGDMPAGVMEIRHIPVPCEGYEKYRSIEIIYTIPSGSKDGKRHSGTQRIAYLPDNEEGKEILELLKIAFSRRLLFTVGTSITTGVNDVVVWNGIHHKTSLRGGAMSHGYPDPTYFKRVKEELAAKGIHSK